MNLHDEHLKTALQHAPDQDVQPGELVRDSVLKYANQAVKLSNPNWLTRLQDWLLHDHFTNAQWAGVGSIAVVLLVVFMGWRGHPEDTGWITAEPASIPESAEIAQTQPQKSLRKEAATAPAPSVSPLPAQADLAGIQVAPAEVIVETKNTAPAPPPAEAKQASKPKPAEAVQSELQSNTPLKDANLIEKTETNKLGKTDAATLQQPSQQAAKKSSAEKIAAASEKIAPNRVVAPEADAPIAATPAAAPAVAAAPAIVAEPAAPSDSAAETESTKNKAIVRGTSQANTASTSEGNISANSDANIGGAARDEKRRKGESHTLNASIVDNHALAKTILQNGGQTLATQDIQAGKYRLLKVLVHAANSANPNGCKATKTQTNFVDAQTGLPIENIDVCLASEQLMQEVAQYNQAVNAWFLKRNALIK